MEYRPLGRTGVMVSEICLGCMTFGGSADESTAVRIIHRALDLGVNFLDTANIYHHGVAEEIVGKALIGRREHIVVATKVRGRMGPGPNDEGLSRLHIARAVEESMTRLRTDYIDLYQVHWPDPRVPMEETLEALDLLVRQGKVRYIGCSNFFAWQIGKALWASDARGLARFVSVQPKYHLLFREIERELLPFCQEEGIGVIVYSPLAEGFLTGKYRAGAEPPAGSRGARSAGFHRYFVDGNYASVSKLEEVATARGKTAAQVALAWVLGHPAVTSAIIGATHITHVEENVGGSGWQLSEEEQQMLAAAATTPEV